MNIAKTVRTKTDTNVDCQLHEFLAYCAQEKDAFALPVMGVTTILSTEQLAGLEGPLCESNASDGYEPAEDESADTCVAGHESFIVGWKRLNFVNAIHVRLF